MVSDLASVRRSFSDLEDSNEEYTAARMALTQENAQRRIDAENADIRNQLTELVMSVEESEAPGLYSNGCLNNPYNYCRSDIFFTDYAFVGMDQDARLRQCRATIAYL